MHQNMMQAIAYKCLLDTTFDNSLHDDLDGTKAAAAYNIVHRSLIDAMIMALMRIWDPTGQDRLSLGNLFVKYLGNHDFVDYCVARASITWVGPRQSRIKNAVDCYYNAVISYDETNKKIKKIKQVRDRTLAHSLNQEAPKTTYVELFDLISDTEEIVNDLHVFVTGTSIGYDYVQEDFNGTCKQCWSFLAESAKKHKVTRRNRLKQLDPV